MLLPLGLEGQQEKVVIPEARRGTIQQKFKPNGNCPACLDHRRNGWLLQVGTKEEPQPDILPKEEWTEEQHPGFPIIYISDFSKTASHWLKLCRSQKARKYEA